LTDDWRDPDVDGELRDEQNNSRGIATQKIAAVVEIFVVRDATSGSRSGTSPSGGFVSTRKTLCKTVWNATS